MDTNTIVVVYRKHKLSNVFDMYIPDLHILVENDSRGTIATLNSRALVYLKAICHYYEESGVPLEFKVTYEEGSKYRKSTGDYVSYLQMA